MTVFLNPKYFVNFKVEETVSTCTTVSIKMSPTKALDNVWYMKKAPKEDQTTNYTQEITHTHTHNK